MSAPAAAPVPNTAAALTEMLHIRNAAETAVVILWVRTPRAWAGSDECALADSPRKDDALCYP